MTEGRKDLPKRQRKGTGEAELAAAQFPAGKAAVLLHVCVRPVSAQRIDDGLGPARFADASAVLRVVNYEIRERRAAALLHVCVRPVSAQRIDDGLDPRG